MVQYSDVSTTHFNFQSSTNFLRVLYSSSQKTSPVTMTFQKFLIVTSKWHQPIPSELGGVSKQVPKCCNKSSWFKKLLIWSFSTKDKTLSLNFYSNCRGLEFLKALLLRQKWKRWAFSVSFVTRSPESFNRKPTFSLVFLLQIKYLQELFLLSFMPSLTQFLSAQTASLHSSQDTCACL